MEFLNIPLLWWLIGLSLITTFLLTYFKVEAWPISAYPMFANHLRAEPLTVYLLYLVDHDGNAKRWTGEAHLYTQLRYIVKDVFDSADYQNDRSIKNWLLSRILLLISSNETLKKYKGVEIRQLKPVFDGRGRPQPTASETVVWTASIEELFLRTLRMPHV